MHSRHPEHYLERYITELMEDENPVKYRYANRFSAYVLPKKELLKKGTIKKLNRAWKKKFGVVRRWKHPETNLQKVEK